MTHEIDRENVTAKDEVYYYRKQGDNDPEYSITVPDNWETDGTNGWYRIPFYLHYNPLDKTCFYKKKTLDITLDDKSLISDKDYTSYIKKNNIRNLSKNYIFLTFVENAPISINENYRIINIKNTELKLSKIIDDNANYSFFIKNPSTNDVVGNILFIKPNVLYPLGYINLDNNLEEMSPYNISFNSIVINEYYKVSTYHVYNPMTINFYNANEKRIDIGSSYKFNIYLLNK